MHLFLCANSKTRMGDVNNMMNIKVISVSDVNFIDHRIFFTPSAQRVVLCLCILRNEFNLSCSYSSSPPKTFSSIYYNIYDVCNKERLRP